MKTSDFDYLLPPELIAQTPILKRDESRLLVLRRDSGALEHKRFFELPGLLVPGDVLVFNNSRVIPARLHGKKAGTGGRVEILLLRRLGEALWEALVKPGKSLPAGAVVQLSGPAGTSVTAEIKDVLPEGLRTVKFSNESLLPQLGEMPLPPYIHTRLGQPERYQTVYARERGSAAAPTAGLHFTPELLRELNDRGVETLYTTLHIGMDTFRPVQVEDPADHPIHHEFGWIDAETAGRVSLAKKQGRRVICVGTTSVRLLEYAALKSQNAILDPFSGWVDLLILPGFKFRMADTVITNFHLPRSSLIMLVSAFAGLELIKKAYAEAVAEKYRFYSFGDAMLIL
jgi:S-adenosylmethionine:tRNA ribosyltransferase-isomerase